MNEAWIGLIDSIAWTVHAIGIAVLVAITLAAGEYTIKWLEKSDNRPSKKKKGKEIGFVQDNKN